MLTQQEYMVLKQSIRHLNIKIDLINENDVVVDSFEGIAVDGNVNLSSDSTYRRTGSLKMILDKKYNLIPNPSSKLWFNSRIGLWAGLKNFNDEIIWFNLGKFAITEIDLDFSLSEKVISCNLVDLMSFLDGTLSGQLSHQARIVPQGVTINDAIMATLSGLGRVSLDNMEINGNPLTLPFTIEKSQGSTVYELVKELVDLYKNYELYYNAEGILRVEQIRNRVSDPLVWDFTDIDLTVDYSRQLDFANVKNSVWTWGKQLNNGIQVVWNYRNRFARNTVAEMNNISEKVKGDICCVINEDKNSYMWTGSVWELLDFKVVPDFRMESIGEKILSISDDKLFNESQAKLKCEYELKQTSDFAETVSFSTLPIYGLKVNDKVRLKVDELGINDEDYLVKSITIPLNHDSLMSVEAQKIYY